MGSEYDRSRSYSHSHSDAHGSYSYGNGYSNNNNMQLQPSYGGRQLAQPQQHELRCYSASYAQSTSTQVGYQYNSSNPVPAKLKQGKGTSGSKSWSLGDPEFQRKKRVASYKMYGVEGKMKGTFRKSLRWIKDRYSQVVYGWW